LYRYVPTVLVVDDEQSIRRALRGYLERSGLTVLEAGSGGEALAMVASGTAIDAVVSDVLMPEVSGPAFYDSLVARAPQLANRVVFLTGAAKDPKVLAPTEQRGIPLLSKMDDFTLVVDAVRLVLLTSGRIGGRSGAA
jgi:CheY-like chemotaxis protein